LPTIPGLGEVVLDEDLDGYVSADVPAGSLRGAVGQVIVPRDYPEDEHQEQVNEAIARFLTTRDEALRTAAEHVHAYYLDTARIFREQGWPFDAPTIESPESVWEHVRFGDEFYVRREAAGGPVYISIECNCAWESEHGLQIVFRDGTSVSKVGPYDGHLSNASAYGGADPGRVYAPAP
jgi:hypothetical protein